jgi:hypothetical protein
VEEEKETAMIARLGILSMALVALAACSRQADDPRPIAGSWFSDIQEVGEHGHSGFAVVSLAPDGGTRANVTLTGGSTGGNHPWYVQAGRCESEESSGAKGSNGSNDPNGSMVGSPGDYPALRPDDSGNASATILIDEQLDPEGDYHVKILQSSGNSTVVGCGDLLSNR